MTKLLLRGDASPTIGAGHISRLVAYAERAVARGWEVSFSGSIDNAEWLAVRFDELGVPRLPAPPVLGELAAGFDAVLVDHYGLGELRKEVNAAGASLISVEDGTFGRRAADVVADCAFAPASRPDDGSGVLLCGVTYAPLRDVVLRARERRVASVVGEPLRVTVVLGGGGEWVGVVSTLLRALRDTGLPFEADVLVRGEPEIPSLAANQRIRVSPPGTGLLDLLVDTDLALSAAGVTLLELCCLGVPTGMIQLVDNQAAGYRGALDLGLAAGLGHASSLGSEVTEVLAELLTSSSARKSLSVTSSSLVDGQGADRVLDAL
ncbi:spore coat protein [Amycolatopsis sp. H20-H5]|uniref:spore coat protein n=1 Tax=Amycolatopsis sp. H20-H5 TaxID=3046309 RepID=UPI002DB574D1|nr:spore coat protein [Amycolatopsis sp. H20-H5]MEC3975701.1 spore coat protein [Amycolatopsis sp. H20-H5]